MSRIIERVPLSGGSVFSGSSHRDNLYCAGIANIVCLYGRGELM